MHEKEFSHIHNSTLSPMSTDKTEKYITMASYTAEENDEISFPAGVVIMVIYKSLTGWWMIKYDGKSGLAPATYMKKIEDEEQVKEGRGE